MIRICVVEDELVIREGLKIILEQAFPGNVEILQAENGERCLDILVEKEVHAIVTDIRMPVVDGLRLMELVREDYPGVRFIVLSGYDDFGYCKQSLRLGAVDYLLKPVDEAELLKAVKKAVHNLPDSGRDAADSEVRPSKIIHEILEYIKRYYGSEISLDVFGEKFHYNSRYLSQLFKKEMGINLVDYLNQVRIQRAKQLLKQDDRLIEDVALKVGYNDPRYFTKIFKKSVGVTPSQYRCGEHN